MTMKIKHSNGETYEGVVQWENDLLIHLKTRTGQLFIIMKMDILSKS